MKRKSDHQHIRDGERMDGLDNGDLVALLEARLLEDLSGAGYLVRKNDISLDRITGISPLEPAGIEHRKRLKSVSSTEFEQYEDVRHSHGRHATGNESMEHKNHSDHTVEQTFTETYGVMERRISTSSGSTPSSPSDSTPATPTPSHYRKDSSAHSENIHFNKYNEDDKDPQTIVNDVLEIIKAPAKCSKRNLYQDGFIYVLYDPKIPGFVKIGRTIKCPTQRKKQIATCSKMKVDFVGSQRIIIGAYHERLEQIIHADLYNERHYFECACSRNRSRAGTPESDSFTKHSEWFRMDMKEADHKVEQWRNWMRQEPYKKPGTPGAGELKSDFRRRAQYCYEHPSKLPEERWTEFMAPYYMAERDQGTLNLLT